jgi:hypothetical protein
MTAHAEHHVTLPIFSIQFIKENISHYGWELPIPKKTYKLEMIIGKLRHIEVFISLPHSVAGGYREVGITELIGVLKNNLRVEARRILAGIPK